MENTIKQNIAKTKSLLCGLQDVKKSFETVSSNIKQEVEYIKNMQANDIPVIPEIDYKSILNGSVSISQIAEIKRRGSLIIRGVFDEQLAREWNEEIVEYILHNDYYTKSIEKEGMDKMLPTVKIDGNSLLYNWFSGSTSDYRKEQLLNGPAFDIMKV